VKKLSEIVRDRRASGVYVLQGTVGAAEVREIAKAHELAFFHLRGRGVEDKDRFFQEAATVLNFPEYFGHNWDAFEECLTDMSWLPAPGYLILCEDLESFRQQARDDYQTFLAISRDAASFWKDSGKAFFVVLLDAGRLDPEIASIEL